MFPIDSVLTDRGMVLLLYYDMMNPNAKLLRDDGRSDEMMMGRGEFWDDG